MSDLNVMMREQALSGLHSRMDAAVVEGNAAEVRKIADDIAKLTLATAPKAAPFTSADVWKVAETKADWLGVDPRKSALANELAKSMNPSKFASAEALADAIIKAVEDDGKTATKTVTPENETDEERTAREAEEAEAAKVKEAAKGPRKTDGPSDGDVGGSRSNSRSSGPWTKLSDAPADVQKEIKRTADKFVPSTAPKEQREKYINIALSSYYNRAQANKGKR